MNPLNAREVIEGESIRRPSRDGPLVRYNQVLELVRNGTQSSLSLIVLAR